MRSEPESRGCKYRGFSHAPAGHLIEVCKFYEGLWPPCEYDDSVPKFCPMLKTLTDREKAAVDALIDLGASEQIAKLTVLGILRETRI